MHRRTFLLSSTASTLAATLARPLWALPADNRYLRSVGLQLWTVRNQLAEDMAGTIRAVKAAGYQQVELMRVLESDELIKAARDNDLQVTSAFIDWRAIGDPQDATAPRFEDIVAKANDIQLKYLVFGYIGKGHRETIGQFQAHAERANRAGEQCRAAGIQLCYHNHSFEFKPLEAGRAGWDVLVDEFDRELVKFECDVFWVAIGGRDPLRTMGNLKGRVAQVHLKDLLKGTRIEHDEGQVPPEAFKELGNGVIDMQAILQVSDEIGVEQCHVEQDQSPDPIVSIGQSMSFLKRL